MLRMAGSAIYSFSIVFVVFCFLSPVKIKVKTQIFFLAGRKIFKCAQCVEIFDMSVGIPVSCYGTGERTGNVWVLCQKRFVIHVYIVFYYSRSVYFHVLRQGA